MKRRRLVLVVTLFLGLVPRAPSQSTSASYTPDNTYTTTLTKEALLASPTWKEDAENPPLSARKAISLAEKLRATLIPDTKDYTWKLDNATIASSTVEGKWYWVIQYTAHRRRNRETGPPFQLHVTVLMDGTVVKPVPLKDK